MNRKQFLKYSAAMGAGVALSSRLPAGAVRAASAGETIPSTFHFSTWGNYKFYQDGFTAMVKDSPQYAKVQFANVETSNQGSLGGGDVIREHLLTNYVAKNWDSMPDCCELNCYDIPLLAKNGILLDITDWVKPYNSDLAPAALEACSYNGRLFGMPWRANTAMLFYREDLWNEAGIDPTQIRLWSDYLSAGKTIAGHKFSDSRKHYLGYVEPAPGINTDLVAQSGGQLFDPKTNMAVFDSDAGFRQAFDFQVELSKAGTSIAMPGWSPAWFQSMGTGVITSYITECWWPEILQNNVPSAAGKWRVMEFPAFTNGGGHDAINGSAVVAAVKKPGMDSQLIWKYLQHTFLNTPVTVSLFNKWNLPTAYLPALQSPSFDYNKPSPFFGGQRLAAIDLSIQAHAHTLHFTPQYALALTTIQTALGDVIAGHASAASAIKAAADKVRSAS